MLNARARFMYDTRTYADVVKKATSEPLAMALSWQCMLHTVEKYERQWSWCPRMSNFFKVHVLLVCATTHQRWRFYKTLEWRNLFYSCRDRVAFFYRNRSRLQAMQCDCMYLTRIPKSMGFIGQCSHRRGDEEELVELGVLRGPHRVDLFCVCI